MAETQSRMKRLWTWLKAPLLFGIPALVFVIIAGAALTQGALVASSTNTFCFSCHLQMDTIVQEYKASAHYESEDKIHAKCADCHVPNDYLPMLKVKIKALADIWYFLRGTVTKENFEQERLRLAKIVWDDMKHDGARNCRDCHQGSNFDLSQQSQRARLNHEEAAKENKICIDCHLGIAHKRVVIE